MARITGGHNEISLDLERSLSALESKRFWKIDRYPFSSWTDMAPGHFAI